MRTPIVLVDQDGPLADWEGHFLRQWRLTNPELPWIPLVNRRNFHAASDYEDLATSISDRAAMRSAAERVCHAKGFYRNLPVVSGAVTALNDMLLSGIEVRICTASMKMYANCVLEKYEWVEEHFGRAFTQRIILSRDKTFIRGDFLIDDHPDPCASAKWLPTWTQILFDAPYNRGVHDKVRMSHWSDWRQLLKP